MLCTKKLLIIIKLTLTTGLGSALRSGNSYTYKYDAHIGTGIPGIRPQAAATGIKAMVEVTMKSRSAGLVKVIYILFLVL